MNTRHRNRGFTLVELLAVIGIIGVLASTIFASFAPAREKARDARRLQDMNTIRTALEFYYENNGVYPALRAYTTADTCGYNWCALETELDPYLETLPRDPSGAGTTYVYYYDSNAGDNFQTYGLMMRFENAMSASRASSDGGFYANFYEIGSQPSYCMRTYDDTGTSDPEIQARWWPTTPSSATVCFGGN